jgi:hypothetical protein
MIAPSKTTTASSLLRCRFRDAQRAQVRGHADNGRAAGVTNADRIAVLSQSDEAELRIRGRSAVAEPGILLSQV